MLITVYLNLKIACTLGLMMMIKCPGSDVLYHYQLPDATPQQIKKAYYDCMKSCHPDLSGNDPDINSFCIFINEVYSVSFSKWIF